MVAKRRSMERRGPWDHGLPTWASTVLTTVDVLVAQLNQGFQTTHHGMISE